MNYLTSINLNQNELQNAVLHPLPVAPDNPKAGQIYYNTAANNLQYYNGNTKKWIVVNNIDLSNYALKTDIKVDDVQLNGQSIISSTSKIANIKLGYHKGKKIGTDNEEGTISKDEFDNLYLDSTSYVTIDDGTQTYKLYRATDDNATQNIVYENTFSDTDGGEITRKIKFFNYKTGETTAKYKYNTIYRGTVLELDLSSKEESGCLTEEQFQIVENGAKYIKAINFDASVGDFSDGTVYFTLTQVYQDSNDGSHVYSCATGRTQSGNKVLYEIAVHGDRTWYLSRTTIDAYHVWFPYEGSTSISSEQYDWLAEDENSYIVIGKAENGAEICRKVFNSNGARLNFVYQSGTICHQYAITNEDYNLVADEEIRLEDTASKVNTFTDNIDNINYPTTKAVVDYVDGEISDVESKIKVTDVQQNGTSVLVSGIANIIAGYQLSISNIDNTITQEQYNALLNDPTSTILYQNTLFHKITNASGGMNYSAVVDGAVKCITISNTTRKPVISQWVGETTSNKTDTIIPSASTSYPSTKAVADYALPLTGGSITGNLTIGGNLTVNGATTTIESTTLAVKDKLIEVARGNTTKLTSPAGLFVRNYDGTHNGAIVYDGDGIAYIGNVVLNDNGDIDVDDDDTKFVPIAGYAKGIGAGEILAWNPIEKIIVSSNLNPDLLVQTDTEQTISGSKTFQNGVQICPSGMPSTKSYTTYDDGLIKYRTVNDTTDVINIFNLPVSTTGGTKTLATTDDFAGYAKKISKLFTGDGSKTTFVIEHELGYECTASLYKVTNTINPTYEMVMADITLAQTSSGGYTATVRFGQAPTANDIFVLVITG